MKSHSLTLSAVLTAAKPLAISCCALIGACGGGGEPEPRNTIMAAPKTTADVQPVQPQDVVYNFSASNPDSYRYPTLQCQGTNQYFWAWTGTQGKAITPAPNPLMGSGAQGETFAAFSTVPSPGEVANPMNLPSDKRAFRWELRSTDPDTAGTDAKRCEFSFGWKEYTYPGKVLQREVGLPADRDYWWAVAVRSGDTRATSQADSQILWQWHDAYGGGLPPFLSLITAGPEMQIQLTYDESTTPRNSTLKRLFPWRTTNWQPDQWMRFVVQAKKDMQNPEASYVNIWLNGEQIVNYRGRFGYLVPQQDYAKVGLYHWISAANPWEPSKPSRVLHTKGPVQVDHRAGYTWRSIDALLD